MGQKIPNDSRPVVFDTLRELIAKFVREGVDSLLPGYTLALGKPLARVHAYEQYPKTEDEIKAVEKVPDPIVGEDDLFTSFIEVGFPGVGEDPYTTDRHTQLTLNFSLRFVMKVRRWKNPPPDFPYTDSGRLFEHIFAKVGEHLRNNRTFGGYDNLTHDYLQQPFADTDRDEETGDPLQHIAEWVLPVTTKGAKQ